MTAAYFLGIDGGGTNCRARVRDADGRLIGEAGLAIEKGFDLAMFNDRLTGEFTHYRQKVHDALASVPISNISSDASRSETPMASPAHAPRDAARISSGSWPPALPRMSTNSEAWKTPSSTESTASG